MLMTHFHLNVAYKPYFGCKIKVAWETICKCFGFNCAIVIFVLSRVNSRNIRRLKQRFQLTAMPLLNSKKMVKAWSVSPTMPLNLSGWVSISAFILLLNTTCKRYPWYIWFHLRYKTQLAEMRANPQFFHLKALHFPGRRFMQIV